MARLDAGLTQERLAERAQVSVRTVRGAESGDSRWPRLSTVDRLIDSLGRDEADRRRLREGMRAAQLGDHAANAPLAPPPPGQLAQLPADVSTFTGREAELAELDRRLCQDSPAAAAVCIVSGPAGVGKTATAVHWAHRVRDRFSDGQLYVNLCGFDAAASPLTADDVLYMFLESLHGPGRWMPDGLTARAALYRSAVADKRLLVVLDNARDADQVRPLLPAGPGCRVVVTSRNPLAGLVAAEGAHAVPLRLLSAEEGRRLLSARLGRERVDGEPDAAAEIIQVCAGLPLALAIVAARTALRPGFSLAAVAADLRDWPARLDALRGDSDATDVRAAISWSYRTLSPAAAGLFRHLGAHPTPDFGIGAAASLLGEPAVRTAHLLAELGRVQLVHEHRPGRFTMHDLVRAYAIELAATLEPDNDRDAAMGRLLDHYIHTARAGAIVLDPARTGPTGPAAPPLAPGVTVQPIDEVDPALAWFSVERPALLALLAAVAGRFDRQLCRLAWALKPFLHRGHLDDAVTAEQARLDAALRLGDEPEQLLAHCNLSRAHTLLRGLDRATHHARLALGLAVRLGDANGRGHAYHEFTWILGRAERWPEALQYAEAALALYRKSGNPSLHARGLNGVAHCLAALGQDPDRALLLCQQALAIFHESGDAHSEAYSWDGRGFAYTALGQPDEAARCHRQAVELHRQTGDEFAAAEALDWLAVAYQTAEDHHAARRAWGDALTIFERYGHPNAAGIRRKLRPYRLVTQAIDAAT